MKVRHWAWEGCHRSSEIIKTVSVNVLYDILFLAANPSFQDKRRVDIPRRSQASRKKEFIPSIIMLLNNLNTYVIFDLGRV